MARVIVAIVALIAIASCVDALPKPPKVFTYTGECKREDNTCTLVVDGAQIAANDQLYLTSVATIPHELAHDHLTLGGGIWTESYALNNATWRENWSGGIVIPYCAVKNPSAGVFFTIKCKSLDKTKIQPWGECATPFTAFDYNITVVVRSQDMGTAGIDTPAVADLPYVAGDESVPYSLTFSTPHKLPPGGWSLVMTINRVDWNANDLVVGQTGQRDNVVGITATPYTATRAAQCQPNVDGLPVPIKRQTSGGQLAVSINNGYVNADNQYGGFEVTENTQYQIVYYASYTTQALVVTASLAPHTTAGNGGDHNLVYSHGSMAAGVILSLIFGGAIGAYIIHWRNQKRVQGGFNQVDETSHLHNRINQIDA